MAASGRVTRRSANLAQSNHRSDEHARVLSWRMESLIRAGYDTEAAWLIAQRNDVDLHLAASLIQRGCAITTALLILL